MQQGHAGFCFAPESSEKLLSSARPAGMPASIFLKDGRLSPRNELPLTLPSLPDDAPGPWPGPAGAAPLLPVPPGGKGRPVRRSPRECAFTNSFYDHSQQGDPVARYVDNGLWKETQREHNPMSPRNEIAIQIINRRKAYETQRLQWVQEMHIKAAERVGQRRAQREHRKTLRKQQRAAKLIQRIYRDHRLVKLLLVRELRVKRTRAAICIQRFVRGRVSFWQLARAYKRAAAAVLCMQRGLREALQRRGWYEIRECKATIQANLAPFDKLRAEVEQAAAVAVQASARRLVVRIQQRLQLQQDIAANAVARRAVVTLQARCRGRMARRRTSSMQADREKGRGTKRRSRGSPGRQSTQREMQGSAVSFSRGVRVDRAVKVSSKPGAIPASELGSADWRMEGPVVGKGTPRLRRVGSSSGPQPQTQKPTPDQAHTRH